MLVEPNLDVMLHDKRVGNKFALVTLALKRARQLNDGSPCQVGTNAKKPVSIALWEMYDHKIAVIEKPEEDRRFAVEEPPVSDDPALPEV
jgi:DNA-directed RNA polymerase subunit omega